jgi:predicted lactoylglutathione lyase
MTTKIFINLPVKDLNRAVQFFTSLGFKFNPQFTDENATCMIISENIFAMLLVEKFFKTFTKNDIADTRQVTETILALSSESREKVDEMMSNAIAAGAAISENIQDQGWMYGRAFQDLDGHHWEVIYMDESKLNKAP